MNPENHPQAREYHTQECPDCGTTLSCEGAESRGDGDMYQGWYCHDCHCRKYEEHASYCRCIDCQSGCSKWHRVEDDPNPSFGEPY